MATSIKPEGMSGNRQSGIFINHQETDNQLAKARRLRWPEAGFVRISSCPSWLIIPFII
jgi:hypothetical protein